MRNWIEWIAISLLIVGGFNFGLVTIGYNLIEAIFGSGALTKIIYGLIGLSAIGEIIFLMREPSK